MKGYEILVGMFIDRDQAGPSFLFETTTGRVTAIPTYVNRAGCVFPRMDDAREIADKLKTAFPKSDIRIREVEI